jgi:RNA polymerase sigma-70 factor (ECF subfamily)
MDRIEQLCSAAQKGDLEAASELLATFYERIFAYLRRRCSNDEDAADLTQKTFSKVWASLSTYRRQSNFSTWVHSIAHHVYVDACRARKLSIAEGENWWLSQPDDTPGPFDSIAQRESAEQLFALVAKLDEDAREVVHLHYYQALTLEQTAEVLSIAVSTVKYRLRRALDFLKRHVTNPKVNS